MDNVVHTVYDLFNRKLFSLPKILLLPGVMSRQPWLVVQVFPIIMLSDWVKAWAVTFLTTKIEKLQEEVQHWQAIRTKVESYDLKNAELLHRSGKESLPYTQRRWEALTHHVQNRLVVMDLLKRSKGFFSFIHRNFVFSVLIDCALANLIAIGKIVSSEIFVFSRAVEDAVDLLLMRSRSEAELARMTTDLERLAQLRDLWRQQRESESLLPCLVASEESSKAHGAHRIILRNLHYSRGTAEVRADHVELGAGVYALTGANGSGKSTLFRVLMSCETNIKPIEFPPSINLLTPMEPLAEEDDLLRETSCEATIAPDGTVAIDDVELDSTDESCDDLAAPGHPIVPRLSISMPSRRVVEISQTFYWPLYARPIDWIMQGHDLDCDDEVTRRRVAALLHDLEFVRPVMPDGVENPTPEEIRESTLDRIVQELLEEKEDWFSDLSGGQKSKVELVRQVFLHETCPDVLLIDETMAPLDPTSKSLVMQSLKDFCHESIIIVIYHMDVQSQSEGDDSPPKDCIPSTNFFNHNIHLDHGILHVRDVC
jgi:energy-coupling factor transporter ATP-binding protein EcfA2